MPCIGDSFKHELHQCCDPVVPFPVETKPNLEETVCVTFAASLCLFFDDKVFPSCGLFRDNDI